MSGNPDYDEDPIRRTLQEIKQFASKSKGENYCCVHQPLLNIPLDHIILDELHLMLRVTDVLISNLIEDVMQWDEKDNILSGKFHEFVTTFYPATPNLMKHWHINQQQPRLAHIFKQPPIVSY